jgi:GAF domain-containing protein
MSIADHHAIQLVAATDEAYARLERTQQFHGRGPLVDSLAANEPMAVRELSAHAEVWPELSSLAGRLGIQSALVIPMGGDGGVELVFSAYTRTVRSWSRNNIIVATQIARRALRALHGSSPWDGLVLG